MPRRQARRPPLADAAAAAKQNFRPGQARDILILANFAGACATQGEPACVPPHSTFRVDSFFRVLQA
jgi:hypothetical protein